MNIIGFFYGIYYYWSQILSTPWHLWIVTIDSPMAVLLFAACCILLWRKAGLPEFLKLITAAYLAKYGLWTMIVIAMYWDYFSAYQPGINVLNFFLHFGMILEAWVLAEASKPDIKTFVVVAALLVVNDLFDYLLGTVTSVPPQHLAFLFAESIAISIAIPVIILLSRRALKKCGKPQILNIIERFSAICE